MAANGASVLAAVDVTDTDRAGQTRSYCKATGNILAVDTSVALKQEALMNFAQWQVKKTSYVAKWLSQKMYGSKPKFMYFAGGSQGEHEAFDAAQRYLEDYDGVIAHYPAYNVINSG